jgi:hypothetical protein
LPGRSSREKEARLAGGAFEDWEAVLSVRVKIERGDGNSDTQSQPLLDEVDSLLLGLRPVFKLAVGKLDQRSRLKGFMNDSCLHVLDLLAKTRLAFDDQIEPVAQVLVPSNTRLSS